MAIVSRRAAALSESAGSTRPCELDEEHRAGEATTGRSASPMMRVPTVRSAAPMCCKSTA